MKVINSIVNGNWSSIDTWDNGVPNLNDVVYVNHTINLDIENSTILDLYITKYGILNCVDGKDLITSNIILIGGRIDCDNTRIICTTSLKSLNIDENIEK